MTARNPWVLFPLVVCLGAAACAAPVVDATSPSSDEMWTSLETSQNTAIDEVSEIGTSESETLPLRTSYTSVETTAEGFVIDGQYRILRGGTLQWFRLPEEVWEDRLRRFAAAGFNTVDMYVPWNLIEPVEGEFQFEEPNLTRFLELCQAHGLYVYFRPGPYITNEMDGGGLPAWLMTRSTKRTTDRDGLVNLRTNDPDYIDAVRRYLDALNAVVAPYQITNGGPIVLYSVENEYDWFEIFSRFDKTARYEGRLERDFWQDIDTDGYFTSLRDIVEAGGIDVPITSCPGNAAVGGMGDVERVIPMPNIYKSAATERIAYDIVTSMHDPAQFGGAYVNYPSASTETDRTASRLNRLVFGGMDGAFAFNVFGMHTGGYRNAMVLNNQLVGQDGLNWGGRDTLFEWTWNNLQNAMVSPTVGYFSGVVDYYGAVGPAGSPREKFYNFRRANLFFDSFEHDLGQALHPHRSGRRLWRGDRRLVIDNAEVGADEGRSGRVHYWLEGPSGTRYVGLTNETGESIELGRESIRFDGLSLPQHTTLTLPTQVYPGPGGANGDTEYARFLVTDLPLSDAATLRYTTSEILSYRPFGGEQLLVLYGVSGTEGELRISDCGDITVDHLGAATVHADESGDFVISYVHGSADTTRLTFSDGRRLTVLVVNRHAAGRTWFPEVGREPLVVIGPDDVWATAGTGGRELRFEHRADELEITTLSFAAVSFDGLAARSRFDVASGLRAFVRRAPRALPDAHWSHEITTGLVLRDDAERAPLVDLSAWTQYEGQPRPLEQDGILAGHAWYRAEFDLDRRPGRRGYPLYIEHASDFVGIYVNGTYVTTVCPVGTEVNSRSWDRDYAFPDLAPYLVEGRNVITFRVEIWGHGSFMWPRGTVFASRAQLPSLGFDAVKGLWGEARIGRTSLERWSVRSELAGERDGFMRPGHDDSTWTEASVPMSLESGEVRWMRTHVVATDLPDPDEVHAPAVLVLEGHNAKATIWLNGELVGRWLSDEGWLRRGSWARGDRDMWMNTSPDALPVPIETLRAAGDNALVIAFEDMSGPDETPGRIERMSFQLAREERSDVAGDVVMVSNPAHRTQVRLR